jgi:hypothetical protein
MEEFLIVFIQFIVEFFINVVADIPFDWPSRNRQTPEPENISGLCFGLLLLGGGLAWLSVFIFPRTLISVSVLRIANLALAPVTSGLLSLFIARRRSLANPNIVPRNHFWQAFWFTVGLVGVRFAYAGRA